jgi:exodeoxyribonuclease-1
MYVFYDFETSGLNPAFEQILQFAAIHTDDDFNEIEAIDERCQLRRDIIPSPRAMAVTGMTPSIITDPSLPTEYQFSHRIAKLIDKWSPSIFTGYNTIAFDEEYLRHCFYHNLHPNLYKTQFDGNARFDILNAVAMTSVIAPDAISLPTNDRGNISLKLEHIAPANGFEGHHAHDALGDVRATIFVAKLIKEKVPEVWEVMQRNIDKSNVSTTLRSNQVAFVIESNFGKRKTYPVCYAGHHPQNANEYAVIDLSQPGILELLKDTDEAIDRALNQSPRLIRRVKINTNPMVFAEDDFSHLSIDADQMRIAELVGNNRDFHERVGLALKRRTDAYEPFPYYEQQIYEGFPSRHDKEVLNQLHEVQTERKKELIESLECPRLQYLGRKLLWLYSQDNSYSDLTQEVEADIQARWNSNLPTSDRELQWTSITKLQQEFEEVKSEQLFSDDELEQWKGFYSNQLNLNF